MRFLCSTRRPAQRSGPRVIGASAMANVALRQVSKRFGSLEAVRGLSFAINDGEFVVLLGPSGAGKTTTLRLVTGLERPDAGSISIDGRDVTQDPPGTRDIAFVFQQYSLYPHLSVYDNLAFPLRSPARRVPEATIRKRVAQTTEIIHIVNPLDAHSPREIKKNPNSRYFASRLGTPQINFLPAGLIPEIAMPPATDVVGIRTEHLQIAATDGGGIVGRVHRIEHLGDQNHVHLEYRGQMLVTLADPHQPLQAGQGLGAHPVHP